MKETIRGGIRFKIYSGLNHGYKSWTVTWLECGRRQRAVRNKYKAVNQLMTDTAKRINSGSQVTIDEERKHAYLRAESIIGQHGVSIEQVATEYHTIKLRCPDVSVYELIDFWNRGHSGVVDMKLIDVLNELVTTKRNQGLSKVYIRDLEQRCGHFVEYHDTTLSEIRADDINAWLEKQSPNPRTRNNFRRNIYTLFEFAKSKHYLPGDWNEMDAVPVAKETSEEIEIFTVEEITKLLKRAEKHQLPFLAIGAFAGVRHAEIVRLDWSDINGDYIKVSKSKAKTSSRRLVPIQPNLVAWINPYRSKDGPVCTYANMSEEMLWLAKQAGVQWKHNALRHSYISYRLAVLQDANKVALEAGNSPQMIFANYRELVTEEQGKEWFSVCP